MLRKSPRSQEEMDSYPSRTAIGGKYELKYGFTANLPAETSMANVNGTECNNEMKISKISSISHDRYFSQGKQSHVDRSSRNSRVPSEGYRQLATEIEKRTHNKEQDGASRDEGSPLQIQITSTFSLNPNMSSNSSHGKRSNYPQTTSFYSQSTQSPSCFSHYSTRPILGQRHTTTETKTPILAHLQKDSLAITFSYFGKDSVDSTVPDDKLNHAYEIYTTTEPSRMTDGEVLKEVWNKTHFSDKDDKHLLKDRSSSAPPIHRHIFNADVRSYPSIPLECYRYAHNTRQNKCEGKRGAREKHLEQCFCIWDYPKAQFLLRGGSENKMLPVGTNNQQDNSWSNSLPITIAEETGTQDESVAMDLKTNETQLSPYFATGEHDLLVVTDTNDNDDKTWLNDAQRPIGVLAGEKLLPWRHQTLSVESFHKLDTTKKERLQQDDAQSGYPWVFTYENGSFEVSCGARQGLKRNPRNSRRSKRKYGKARFYVTPAPEPFQNLEMQLALENDKEPVVKIPNYFFDVTQEKRAYHNPKLELVNPLREKIFSGPQDLNVQPSQQSCLPFQKPLSKPTKPALSEVKCNKEYREVTTLENSAPCKINNKGTRTLDVYKNFTKGQGALILNKNPSSVRSFQFCSFKDERPKSAFVTQSSLTSVSCPPPTLMSNCPRLTSRNQYQPTYPILKLPQERPSRTIEGVGISYGAENSLKSMVAVSSPFQRSREFFQFHDMIAKRVSSATCERKDRLESTECGFPSSSSQNQQTTNQPKSGSSKKMDILPQLGSSKANDFTGEKEGLSRSETWKGILHHDVNSTYTQTSAAGNPTKEVPIGERKYQCEVCGRAFSRSNTLITHKRIHTGDRPFPCDLCGRAFRQLGNLTRHKLTHASIKPHACPQCNKCFSRTSNLNTHMRTHTNYKPFSCDFCGKGFHQKVDMKIHRYTHTGEKPHRCSKCGRGFKQLTHLKYHMRTHSAVRMYKCEHCGKGFNQKGNLQAHIYGHTGNRPYKCDICGKGFTLTSTLNTHKRTHAPTKPFKCEFCEKAFYQKNALKTHYISSHPYTDGVCLL